MTPTNSNHRLICLTGGVATGKSRVGAWFSAHGWNLICTDEIVHQLYEPEQALPKTIESEFGKKTLTPEGRVNRKVLSEIVFKDSQALSRLNEIVHPAVREEWTQRVQASRSTGQPAMVMIPLAYETKVVAEFEQIWVVACSLEEQKKRLLERGISSNQVEQRIASQMPLQKKMDLADIVIWNNDSWQLTEKQLDPLLNA